jgi:hypothetical protein
MESGDELEIYLFRPILELLFRQTFPFQDQIEWICTTSIDAREDISNLDVRRDVWFEIRFIHEKFERRHRLL